MKSTSNPRSPGRKPSATSLHGARTRKEIALAELREIEVRKKRGELLEAAAVAAEWASILRAVRAAVLAVPSRVRSRLPHLTAYDASVIDEELRATLMALGNAAAPTTERKEAKC